MCVPRAHAGTGFSQIFGLQATFDISLTTETGLTTLSNMPVASTEDRSGGLLAWPFLFFVSYSCLCLQATFDISLTTETGLTALSNMPVASTQVRSGGLTTTQFATSPPMSTYLVALIMGNLTSVSTMVPHPVSGQPDRNVSIYGTPDR